MTLRVKLLVLSGSVIVSAGGAIAWLAGRTVWTSLVREAGDGHVARVRELAERLPEGVRRRDERRLLPLLQSIQERTGALEAMALDLQGTVLAHTNVVEAGKTLRDPATARALERETPDFAEARAGGDRVLDVVIPVRSPDEDFLLAGGAAGLPPRLGTLRFRVPLRDALATEARIIRAILLILGGVGGVAFVIVLWFNARLLAPIRLLEEGAARIGRGELDGEVAVRTRDEFGRLAEAFNRMSGALRDESARRRDLQSQLVRAGRMEAMGHVAAKVAHDFNNMLQIITGFGGILRRRLPPGEAARADVDEILDAGDRAAAMCRDLLAFSKGQVLQPVPLELNAWLAESAGLLRRLAGERAELVVEPGAGVAWVKADPGQLTQVATNLVANARDAMPGSGRITLGTTNVVLDADFIRNHPAARPGDYVEWFVADTGTGMDEATLARMFEPFFTTKSQDQGTGLGLASVHGIVQQSGGYVWAESSPGKGTTFRVCLPRAEAGASAHAVAAAAAPRPEAAAGGRRGAVLVVDDEPAVREFARRVLAEAGFETLAAGNGPEALRLAAEHQGQLSVLVTDAAMPQVSGFELARRLAAARPGLKVIVMSGFAGEAAVGTEAAALGYGWLPKPVRDEALVSRVREALG